MICCFLGLFRRGGYVGSVVSGNVSDPADKTREERERFSVSAIAFCLEHDRVFRRHFLETFLKVLGARNPWRCRIQLEPCRQQDLLIEFDDMVVVVEFKLGAKLEKHQRWDRAAFWNSGYGKDLLTKYADKDRFYFIVGYELPPNDDRRINCKTLPWKALLPSKRKETPIERDLYDCIAKFGIPIFYTRRMKIPNLQEAANTAVNCVPYLRTICGEAGLRDDGVADISEGHFGIYVKAKPPKEYPEGVHAKLRTLAATSSRKLAWLGYEMSEDEKLRATIYFYCSAPSSSLLTKALAARYKKNFKGWTRTDLAVYKDANSREDDSEWFKGVVQVLVRLSKKKGKRSLAGSI